MRFNTAVGVAKIGYHETITRSYLLLIHAAQQARDTVTFEEFREKNPELFLAGLTHLKRFYSDARLMSDVAKHEFVSPDLRPLPAEGVIRDATANDAEAILEIYAPYIQNSTATFETEIPQPSEIAARIHDHQRFGWYVYDVGGKILGYSYASKHRERSAYRWCCEVSVYVAGAAQRQGLGRLLYGRLFHRLREIGMVNAYAGITLPNASSVGLHESLGFRPIGVYEKIGFKLGDWHDVGWWGLKLTDAQDTSQFRESPGLQR